MGDRLATIDMDRKGGCCAPFGGAGSPSNTMWPGTDVRVLVLSQGQERTSAIFRMKNDAITVTVIILTTCRIAIYFDVYASVCCSSAGCYGYYTTGNNNRSVLFTRTLLLSTNVIVSYIKSEITQRHIYKPLCCGVASSFCGFCVDVCFVYKQQFCT